MSFARISREHALYYLEHSYRSYGFNRLTFEIGREIMDDLADILTCLAHRPTSDEIMFRPSKIEVTFICDMIGLGRYAAADLYKLGQRLYRAVNHDREEHCLLDHLLCHEYIDQLYRTRQTQSEL
jgi:hypothetical protein